MELSFYKYQGTGNDFIMIDNRNEFFNSSDNQLVARLCDRRFGIGADGLILLENDPDVDFKMVYFNSDGNTSSMCGNGGRCIVKFAFDLGVIADKTSFIAIDGLHDAYIENNLVHLKMINIDQIERNEEFFFMNTGSPHYVEFVNELDSFPVYAEGFKIRNNDRFKKEGTNVNFVQCISPDTIGVRTYERGVEDETWSCGTGVTASAIAASFKGYNSPVNVKTKGGDLLITFSAKNNMYEDVFLCGPAERVFEGVVNI